jgi:hypothetical protein
VNDQYFDTVRFEVPDHPQMVGQIVRAAVASKINLGYRRDGTIHVALDETVDLKDIRTIVTAFSSGIGKVSGTDPGTDPGTVPGTLPPGPAALGTGTWHPSTWHRST